MVFNPFESESEQEKADNAREWNIAEVNAASRRHLALVEAHTRVAHHATIAQVGNRFVAQCACGWQQRGYCHTRSGARQWAETHDRTGT